MVDDKLLAAPETGKAAALADHELNRRIADRAEMIRLALRDHERAVAQQRRCQKSAVLSAWNFEDELRKERVSIATENFPLLSIENFSL